MATVALGKQEKDGKNVSIEENEGVLAEQGQIKRKPGGQVHFTLIGLFSRFNFRMKSRNEEGRKFVIENVEGIPFFFFLFDGIMGLVVLRRAYSI